MKFSNCSHIVLLSMISDESWLICHCMWVSPFLGGEIRWSSDREPKRCIWNSNVWFSCVSWSTSAVWQKAAAQQDLGCEIKSGQKPCNAKKRIQVDVLNFLDEKPERGMIERLNAWFPESPSDHQEHVGLLWRGAIYTIHRDLHCRETTTTSLAC